MSIEIDYLQLQSEAEDLLDRVERGEMVVITQNGTPVAQLIPHVEQTSQSASATET